MIETRPCPTPTMLAAYLDGKLSPAERVEIEHHIASCEDCFEQLAGAAAFHAEEAERGVVTVHPSARPGPARWIAIAASVAALVIVGLWLRRGQPGVGGAPEVLAWAERLGGTSELKSAAARAWKFEGGGLAFGAGLPPDKRAFRLGVHLLDARVALEARDDQALFGALERAAALLPGEARADFLGEFYRSLRAGAVDLTDSASHGEDLDWLAAKGRAIDPAAFDRGAWAETGRLATLGKRTDLLASDFVDLLDALIETPGADPAVDRALMEIHGAIGDRMVSAEELPNLERSFEQLLHLH